MPLNSVDPDAATSIIRVELQQLRDQIQGQSAELAAQRATLQDQQKKIEALETELKIATSDTRLFARGPEIAHSPATPELDIATTTVDDTAQAKTTQDTSAQQPIVIRFKGVTLTPTGFFAAESVWRQRGLVSDVNTPFNSLPFSNSSAAALSDLNFSARQSRVGMLVEGKLKNAAINGYYEADFLSAGTTSNNNQSNSYTFRQRQFWA